jgi:quinone-modifying oxidoreductase subunit QmoB
VVTNHQFEEIAKAGKIVRPPTASGAKSVVFVQSPGKGDSDGDFAYAGAVTSMVSLKQAKYVREDYPTTARPLSFTSICAPPAFPKLSTKACSRIPGIFMTKGAVMGVSKNGDGMIVDAENTLLGEKLQVKADLVVLGAGMVPVTKDDPVVNLAYRQGPGFRDIGLFNGYAIPTSSAFPMKPNAPAFMPPAPSVAP